MKRQFLGRRERDGHGSKGGAWRYRLENRAMSVLLLVCLNECCIVQVVEWMIRFGQSRFVEGPIVPQGNHFRSVNLSSKAVYIIAYLSSI